MKKSVDYKFLIISFLLGDIMVCYVIFWGGKIMLWVIRSYLNIDVDEYVSYIL